MVISLRVGMKEGGLPFPIAFQYLVLMIRRACGLNLVVISLLALRGLQFHFIKMAIPTLKTLYFEASKDVMTESKSQALHIIRIKY